VVVAAADAPGRSSDYDAVLWAERFRARRVFNLSNISHVYTADPRTSAAARPLADLTWRAYRRLVGQRWSPRLSSPFDPVATARAARLRLTVAVLDGRNVANVRRAFAGERFTGTLLHP
jgi:uridylate kinase